MKDYLSYTVEDFATDESYLRYYFKEREEDIRFWSEWIGLHPEKLDIVISANNYIDAFSIRISEPEFQKEQQRFIRALQECASSNEPDETEATGSFKIRSLKRKLVWAAAILLLVAGAPLYIFFWKNNSTSVQPGSETLAMIDKYVPKGKQEKVMLPDGSIVQLNGDSRLTYPSKFTGTAREVQLTGEAFFRVKHDTVHPFHVLSGNLVTTVLGTSFNVKSYPNEKQTKVALVTGKVRLDRVGDAVSKQVMGETLILAPAEMGVFNRHNLSLEKTPYDIDEATGWQHGIVVFKNADFNEIADRLDRMYDVRLINQSSKTKFRFKATFTNASAEEIVKTICMSKKLTYTVRGNVITIQ